MPEFGSRFSGQANDRKLKDQELIRAIRFAVAAEYEATQLYMPLAESTTNKLAVKVLKEIADEELVHVGEFLRLLGELAPDEEKFYARGAKEVEEKIKKKKLEIFAKNRPNCDQWTVLLRSAVPTTSGRRYPPYPLRRREGQRTFRWQNDRIEIAT